MYDRGHSAAAHIKPGEVDWKKVFGKGVRWFHTGGICTALSDSSAAVVKESMEAAHAAGAIVSYDLNFRSKLWSSSKAIAVTKDLVPYIDVLIGNEEDFQKVLGFKVEGVDESLKKLPLEGYKRMVEQVVTKYPHIQAVGTTLREVVSGLVNNWSAILYYDGKFYESKRYEGLEIEDRVGGGDGFCSGVVYSFFERRYATGSRRDGRGARRAAAINARRHEHDYARRSSARHEGWLGADQAVRSSRPARSTSNAGGLK